MIISEFSRGWLLDHSKAVNNCYKSFLLSEITVPANDSYQVVKCHNYDASDNECGKFEIGSSRVAEELHTYTIKKDLFCIYWPFMMDSQFKSFLKRNGHQINVDIENKYTEEHYELKMMNIILEETSSLTDYFCQMKSCNCPLNNNLAARQIAEEINSKDCNVLNCCSILHNEDHKCNGICDRVISNYSSQPSLLCVLDDTFLIPAKCSFLISDVRYSDVILQANKMFHAIVLDPPWENKSVKRKRSYDWLSDADLAKIPVSQLAHDGCLVVLWSTNNSRQIDAIKTLLFPAWQVTLVAQWYWLKVTRHGKPIFPLNVSGKKPYERIFLGLVQKSNKVEPAVKIPEDKVIVSVPCGLHSSKPPLFEILQPYLPENPQCLEIFARNLLPNWTSWGNEVLKLQHIDFYDKA